MRVQQWSKITELTAIINAHVSMDFLNMKQGVGLCTIYGHTGLSWIAQLYRM